MKRIGFVCSLAMAVMVAMALTAPAQAQATRTWVSGVGDDANPCSRTAPCKTFAGAISKTATAGEIDCLDPGGFGGVTITKSITLDCGSGVGSILVSGTNGITISASGSTVTIRNMSLEGLGTGLSGIEILAAAYVHVENVQIHGFTVFGVQINSSSAVNLSMENDTILGGNATGGGVGVNSTSGIAAAELHNLRIFNTQNAVQGASNSSINLSNSDVSMNVFGVVSVGAGSGIDVINCQMNYNSTAAVQSIGGSTMRVMSSTLHRNGIAFNPNGGFLLTDGNNTNDGNTSIGSSTGATPTKI